MLKQSPQSYSVTQKKKKKSRVLVLSPAVLLGPIMVSGPTCCLMTKTNSAEGSGKKDCSFGLSSYGSFVVVDESLGHVVGF